MFNGPYLKRSFCNEMGHKLPIMNTKELKINIPNVSMFEKDGLCNRGLNCDKVLGNS